MIDRRFILEGMECICSIGFYEHERAAPQRVLIDAELVLAGDNEPTDDDVESPVSIRRNWKPISTT